MGKIYVVGLGPGDENNMTFHADEAVKSSDIVIGYKVYIDLIKDIYPDKEYIESGMRQEIDRCETCIKLAEEGKTVSLVCSGDAGIYGMASPLLETAEKHGFSDVEIVPGITAASAGAAILGAPLSHDFCVISLSDLLTPWEVIENRLICAAKGDFCIVLYNPSSKKRQDYLKKACNIMSTYIAPDTACGYVRNIAREGMEKKLCTFKELSDEQIDMCVTVFIGNSQTKTENNRLITPRGYKG